MFLWVVQKSMLRVSTFCLYCTDTTTVAVGSWSGMVDGWVSHNDDVTEDDVASIIVFTSVQNSH